MFDTVTGDSIQDSGAALPDLSGLSRAEKDALILALWQRGEATERRIAELEAHLGRSPKTPDNSSLPLSKGQKANQPDRGERKGPRRDSLGRQGGDRPLASDSDETVIAKALVCVHCQCIARRQQPSAARPL
jgi:transposase